jgi:hypothetical protein
VKGFLMLCLGLLFFNSCINPISINKIEETGFLTLDIGIIQPNILGKTKLVVADTTITLKYLILKFTANNGHTLSDTINTTSYNIRNNNILPTRNYQLEALKTWNLKIRGVDGLDSLVYYKDTTFDIKPADTTRLSCILQSRFTIFVGKFISTNSSIKAIQKIVLKIDNRIVGTYDFSPKQKVFNQSLAFKYLSIGISHRIDFLAYTSSTFIQYSGGGNFIPISGQDLTITFPLN